MDSTNKYQDKKYVEFGVQLDNNIFKRNMMIYEHEIEDYIREHGNKGVYTTIYKYDNKNQDEASLIGPFYIDIDSENEFEKAREDAIKSMKYLSRILGIDKNQVNIYFSGKKGIHITVDEEILGIEPSKDLNTIYKMLASDIDDICINSTIDLSIYDNKRMFRIPFSIHQDTGLYKIAITYDELLTLSLDKIKELAKAPRIIETDSPELSLPAQSIMNGYKHKLTLKSKEYKKSNPKKRLTYTPPCIENLIENPPEQGDRNNASIALCSFMVHYGYSYDKAEEKIIDWAGRCDPPLNKIEAIATLKSAFKKEYNYGCSSLKHLSKCDVGRCSLVKRRGH